MLQPISIVIPYNIKNNELLIWGQVRESSDSLNGLLEFPGGKVEPGESSASAAARETSEETKVELKQSELIKFKTFEFSTVEASSKLIIFVFLFDDKELLFDPKGWQKLEYLKQNPNLIPPNNTEIIDDLNTYFQEFSLLDVEI